MKGNGDVSFNKDKLVKLNIFSSDLKFKQSPNEEIHFYTGDSYFYLDSKDYDDFLQINVKKFNPVSNKNYSLSDLVVEVPMGSKIDLNLLSTNVFIKNVSLKYLDISLKKGDLKIKNLDCEEFFLNSMSGDVVADLSSKQSFIDSIKGDIQLYFHNEISEIKIKSLNGDVLLSMGEPPLSVEISNMKGDAFINGRRSDEAKSNGKGKVRVQAFKGDINILYPVNKKRDSDDDGIKKVLEMLKNKKITREQAVKLLDSLQSDKEVIF